MSPPLIYHQCITLYLSAIFCTSLQSSLIMYSVVRLIKCKKCPRTISTCPTCSNARYKQLQQNVTNVFSRADGIHQWMQQCCILCTVWWNNGIQVMRQKSMMIVWKIFEPWVHQKIQRWHLRTLPWIIKLQRAFSAVWVELTAANEWPRHSCSLQPTLPEWTVATINTLDCYKNAATLENLPDIIILYIRC